MSPAQERVIMLLQADKRRDLYEGADVTGKHGCGLYWVTHSAEEKYNPLTTAEVEDLESRALIIQRFPGFFKLKTP